MGAIDDPAGEPRTAPAILIVDDSRAGREETARMVEALGYRAVCAGGGLEGLRLVREERPSLVLLDMEMPSIDGLKTAAMIKALPRFVPVIMVTGASDLESKRRGQAAGADDFLAKPFALDELRIRIAAMLRIKSLTDELEGAKRRLAELADTDALTGLPNRRSFDTLYAAEFERATRYGRPLSVLIVDVDHFKRVNDERGHPAGDAALRAVAQALAATVRQSDRVSRYGGEEFVVVAPETQGEGARSLGERLRAAVAALSIETAAGPLRLTVSVGGATLAGAGERESSGANLLRRADEALYRAKSGGRDRVVLDGD